MYKAIIPKEDSTRPIRKVLKSPIRKVGDRNHPPIMNLLITTAITINIDIKVKNKVNRDKTLYRSLCQ